MEGFGEADITSEAMRRAVRLWYGLYYDFDGDGKTDPAQRVPFVIVDGVYKAVFGEYSLSAADGTVLGGVGEQVFSAALDSFDKIRAEVFLQACIGGEALIKPLPGHGGFLFGVIGRGNMLVLERGADGGITDLVTGAMTVRGTPAAPVYYRLTERRTLGADGLCTVQNKLYKSDNADSPGRPVPLSALPEYAGLQPVFTFPDPLGGLGLIPVRMPGVNCVDGSPDAVSLYAAAAREILKLYAHEARTQDEYDLTAPHLIASADLLRRDREEIPRYITSLLDDDPSAAGLTVWNPKPNQTELEARDDQIKRSIENIVGLRRGFLSKTDTQERTATEILSTSVKMAHLVKDLQRMWDGVVRETLRVCSLLAPMYAIPWAGREVAAVWGNGVLYDEEKEFDRLSRLVEQGHLTPEYLIDRMGIKALSPERLAEIRAMFIRTEYGHPPAALPPPPSGGRGL
jgi:hypothetical protein